LFKEIFYSLLNENERLSLARLAPFESFTLPFAIEATGNEARTIDFVLFMEIGSFEAEKPACFDLRQPISEDGANIFLMLVRGIKLFLL
jgi:hypothetical protein